MVFMNLLMQIRALGGIFAFLKVACIYSLVLKLLLLSLFEFYFTGKFTKGARKAQSCHWGGRLVTGGRVSVWRCAACEAVIKVLTDFLLVFLVMLQRDFVIVHLHRGKSVGEEA